MDTTNDINEAAAIPHHCIAIGRHNLECGVAKYLPCESDDLHDPPLDGVLDLNLASRLPACVCADQRYASLRHRCGLKDPSDDHV